MESLEFGGKFLGTKHSHDVLKTVLILLGHGLGQEMSGMEHSDQMMLATVLSYRVRGSNLNFII